VSSLQTDEESVAIEEVRALGEAVQEVELSIEGTDIDAIVDQTLAPERVMQPGVASEVRTAEGRSLLM
jgi:multidrug resistance efflux pump